ncbi:MAG: hypothetical protein JNL10_06175 [Verrucomicrobiales bacterium]|nr:hypothetical protein [Verrucomicrobiales bacterium]
MTLRRAGLPFLMAGTLVSTLGQGVVKVENNFIPPGAQGKAYVTYGYGQGVVVPKDRGRVEVLDKTGSVISPVKDGTGNALSAAGLFFLGELSVPGTSPGDSAELVIRAWDPASGDTFESAWLRASTRVTVTGLGGGGIPVPKLVDVSNFAGLELRGAKVVSVDADAEQWSIRLNILPGVAYELSISKDLNDWTNLYGSFGVPLDDVPPLTESLPPPFHNYDWVLIHGNLPAWMSPDNNGAHYFRVTTVPQP